MINYKESPAYLYLCTVAPNSQRVYMDAMKEIVRVISNTEIDKKDMEEHEVFGFQWQNLTYADALDVKAKLGHGNFKYSSVNRILVVLRNIIKMAISEGMIDTSNIQDAIRITKIPQIKGMDNSLPNDEITKMELETLINGLNSDKNIDIRDRAMISLLFITGLRRSEIIRLNLSDLDTESGQVTVYESKGHKSRDLFIPEPFLSYLNEWLHVRGDMPGKIFLKVPKGGRVVRIKDKKGLLRGITGQTVRDMVARRSMQLLGKHTVPTDYRRKFAAISFDLGIDISTIADDMGHSDLKTTKRYDPRRGRQKKSAANKRGDWYE